PHSNARGDFEVSFLGAFWPEVLERPRRDNPGGSSLLHLTLISRPVRVKTRVTLPITARVPCHALCRCRQCHGHDIPFRPWHRPAEGRGRPADGGRPAGGRLLRASAGHRAPGEARRGPEGAGAGDREPHALSAGQVCWAEVRPGA